MKTKSVNISKCSYLKIPQDYIYSKTITEELSRSNIFVITGTEELPYGYSYPIDLTLIKSPHLKTVSLVDLHIDEFPIAARVIKFKIYLAFNNLTTAIEDKFEFSYIDTHFNDERLLELLTTRYR